MYYIQLAIWHFTQRPWHLCKDFFFIDLDYNQINHIDYICFPLNICQVVNMKEDYKIIKD
jgi:hypothetical protein